MVSSVRLAGVGILCTVSAALPAATLRVDPHGGDFTAIQPALDAAAAGDIVLVAPGEYVISEPLSFHRLHDPADPSSPPVKDLTLRSEAGPSETIVRLASTDPDRASVLIFEHGESRASTVVGFRITGGRGTRLEADGATFGGGILCIRGSSPTLRDVTVIENAADLGGGLYCDESSAPALSSCTFRRNRAMGEGGAIFANGDLRLANSVVVENFAAATGGIVAGHSQGELVHCTITGNASQAGPGGVYCGGRPWKIRSSILWGNAGGSLESDSPGVPEVSYCVVEAPAPWPGPGNLAQDPLLCGWGTRAEVFVDALYPYRGEGTPSQPYSNLQHAAGFNVGWSLGSPCLGAGEGGTDIGADRGACSAPGASRRLLRLAAGTHEVGMLVLGSGRVTIEGAGAAQTTILGSIAGLRAGDELARLAVREGAAGGVLVAPHESPALEDCDLADNLGPGLDAAFDAAPQLSRCVIARNRAPPGGVFCRDGSRPRFSDCAIRDNAGDWAGGAFCASGAAPTFERCVFTGNSAPDGGAGIGFSNARPYLERCTIAGNLGKPLHCSGSQSGFCRIELKSCIVWHNEGPSLEPADLPGAAVSFSAIESEAGWPGAGNISEDPRLCGWDVGGEVFVDSGASGPGTGTASDPFPDFSWATSYSLALTAGSACIGAGEGGVDMGAPAGTCSGGGGPLRTVHLVSGDYDRLPRRLLLEGASVVGQGATLTLVRGPVEGLSSGGRLVGVAILLSEGAGITIATGEAPEIEDCFILHNRGDGVVVGASDARFRRCNIRSNGGRGVVALGGRFEHTTVAGNFKSGVRADAGPVSLFECAILGNGGSGVEAGEGECTLERSRIAGNALDGCTPEPYAHLRLTNCLVYANAGAGVRGAFKATVEVLSSTVAANPGGGLVCGGGAIGSISWGNGEEPACPRGGDNLIGGDPRFLDEGSFDFGRFTAFHVDGAELTLPAFIVAEPDYRLEPDSPAIDAVSTANMPPDDFAGHARPCGLAADIGAFEMGGCAAPGAAFVRGDADADGALGLVDAIVTLDHLFRGGPAPACLESADLNDSGGVDIADPVYELMHLFAGGPSPPAPFPECGVDPTADQVPCGRFAACSPR